MKINIQHPGLNARPISSLIFKYQKLTRKFFRIILDVH
jgi:hypothetical protein